MERRWRLAGSLWRAFRFQPFTLDTSCFFWSRSSVCGCAAAQHVSAAGVDMRPFRTHRQSSPGLGTAAAAPYRVQHRTLHNARPAADGSPEVGDHPPVMVSLGTDRGPPTESTRQHDDQCLSPGSPKGPAAFPPDPGPRPQGFWEQCRIEGLRSGCRFPTRMPGTFRLMLIYGEHSGSAFRSRHHYDIEDPLSIPAAQPAHAPAVDSMAQLHRLAQAKEFGLDGHGLLGQQTSMPPQGQGCQLRSTERVGSKGICESLTAEDLRSFGHPNDSLSPL